MDNFLDEDTILIIKRVVYGMAGIPIEDREYKIVDMLNCPVGTVKDWQEYAKEHGYDEVKVLE